MKTKNEFATEYYHEKRGSKLFISINKMQYDFFTEIIFEKDNPVKDRYSLDTETVPFHTVGGYEGGGGFTIGGLGDETVFWLIVEAEEWSDVRDGLRKYMKGHHSLA